ncbi:MAG: hypothetical protein LBJ67_13570 [Planctomycetaceae bacterium]|jgi:hypothetical protein|nr:hypothetical protein [Planctomycetaceae bacterium]
MPNAHYIPGKDSEFLAWSENFLTQIVNHATAWGIPTDLKQALQTAYDDFYTFYMQSASPTERTAVITEQKNVARKELEKQIRELVGYWLKNPVITDADRIALGLPIHKTTHTPAPVATTYPDFDIDSSTIRRLTIHFYDQGQKKSKAKPVGQHGAEIRWAILDAPTQNVDDLIHSSFDTHTPFTLDFNGTQRGQTVYFCLRWENTRGEKGPWSEITSAIVP